jgi:hypothetical protein
VSATPSLMSPIYDFLRDVWIRNQSIAVASWRATDLATHLSLLATHPSKFYHHVRYRRLTSQSPAHLFTLVFTKGTGTLSTFIYRRFLYKVQFRDERGGEGVSVTSYSTPPPLWGQIHYKGHWKGWALGQIAFVALVTMSGPKNLDFDFQGPPLSFQWPL